MRSVAFIPFVDSTRNRQWTYLVVTPTYNERENLPLLAAGVLQHDGVRLLVVDDGSPDGTGAIADRLAAEHPGRVEVMHRTGARGLGRSYIDGLLHAHHGRARRLHLPDGLRPVARSGVPAGAGRRGRRQTIS